MKSLYKFIRRVAIEAVVAVGRVKRFFPLFWSELSVNLGRDNVGHAVREEIRENKPRYIPMVFSHIFIATQIAWRHSSSTSDVNPFTLDVLNTMSDSFVDALEAVLEFVGLNDLAIDQKELYKFQCASAEFAVGAAPAVGLGVQYDTYEDLLKCFNFQYPHSSIWNGLFTAGLIPADAFRGCRHLMVTVDRLLGENRMLPPHEFNILQVCYITNEERALACAQRTCEVVPVRTWYAAIQESNSNRLVQNHSELVEAKLRSLGELV